MHLHAKYHKPMWKNKKSLGRTRFGPSGRTDRVITIGHPPQSGGALINNHFRHQWWSIKMPRTRWQFVTVKSKFKVKGHQQWYTTHRLEVVYLHVKYEKPVLNDKKVTARTWFVMDARTSLTLRSKVCGGALINNHLRCQWWSKKTYSPDMICYGRTDRLITIGRPPQSGGALIKIKDTTWWVLTIS
jgi:hypothetical protein